MQLKEILSTTLGNSPTVLSAQKRVESAQLDRQNASAVFLPSLDLNAIHGFQGNRPSTYPTPWSSSTTLTLTENLYDNGESLAKLKIAENNLKMAETQLKSVRGKTILNVAGLYFDYCSAILSLRFAERNQQQLEKQLGLARELFHQGVKTRKDYVSFQAQAQRGSIDVIASKNSVAKTLKALSEAMGLSTDDLEVEPTFKSKAHVKDLPASISNIFLLEQDLLTFKRENMDLQIGISRRRNLPQVNVAASAGYGSSTYLNSGRTWGDGETASWNALVTLNWNLWDWGQRSRSVDLTRLQQQIEEQDFRAQLLSAQKDLENFGVDLKNFSQSYELVKNLRKIEEDSYKFLENEYRLGRLGYLELMSGLTNLLDAQLRDNRIDFDLNRLWLRNKFYQGELDENVLN